MKSLGTFAGGLGAGAALLSLLAAATWLWKPVLLGAWLLGARGKSRTRLQWDRAERLARNSPRYLDACRAAGL